MATSRYNVPDRNRRWLTRRQLEILGAYLDGMESRKEVSDYMCMSIRTLDWHTEKIFRLLGVHSIHGAICTAIREGFMQVRGVRDG